MLQSEHKNSRILRCLRSFLERLATLGGWLLKLTPAARLEQAILDSRRTLRDQDAKVRVGSRVLVPANVGFQEENSTPEGLERVSQGPRSYRIECPLSLFERQKLPVGKRPTSVV